MLRARITFTVAVFSVQFLALGWLTGCSVLNRNPEPQTKYVLDRPACSSALKESGPAMIISVPRGPSLMTGNNIVFSKSPAMRAPYRFSSWAFPFVDQFSELLTRNLECSGFFGMVTHTAPGVRADYLLNTEILDLYHDAGSLPGKAIVDIRYELIHLPTRSVRASQIIRTEAEVPQANAEAAVKAFNATLAENLDDLQEWLKERINLSASKVSAVQSGTAVQSAGLER